VRTVQGELDRALATIVRTDVKTVVAGRTDAGVHARGQVVSFYLEDSLDVARTERSLRSMLLPEIAIVHLAEADDGFDARFSARSRTYRYSIDDSTVPDPLTRLFVWHVGQTLDVGAMNEASSAFVGTHDFASLCRAQEGKTTERTVLSASWERGEPWVVYEVEARAFCHQMVRSMVALCVEVGRGRIDASSILSVLEARDRAAARGAAPPHGLVLERVAY
jgi:tRNA pseudouridine38-40 synthase